MDDSTLEEITEALSRLEGKLDQIAEEISEQLAMIQDQLEQIGAKRSTTGKALVEHCTESRLPWDIATHADISRAVSAALNQPHPTFPPHVGMVIKGARAILERERKRFEEEDLQAAVRQRLSETEGPGQR